MNRLKCILILLCLGVGLQAQSLDDYLRIAAEQNPTVKAKFSFYQAALEQVNQQGALPDPTLSFGYFISPVETRVGAQRFKLSISQMFPWMGTLKVRQQAAASLAKVRFEEFQEAKNQLFLNVRTSWLDLYELEEEIKISESNLEILKSYEPITKTKYESNLVSLADLVRVQIKIDEAKIKLDLLKLKRKPLISEFNTLLNRDLQSEINTSGTLSSQSLTNHELDSALSSQPRILAANSQLDALDAQIALAELKRKPNVGFGLDYGFINKRTDAVVTDNGKDILMPMVSVTLPIFGKKNRALKREVELKKEGAEANLDAITNDIKNSWTKAEYKVEKAEQEIALYNQEIEKTNLLLRILTGEYSNDNSNFEELLATQQSLLQLQLAKTRANVSYYKALFNKEYLTGLTLSTVK